MKSSVLRGGNDNLVFTERSEELNNALENGRGGNTSLEESELINLRLENILIDSIGKGIRVNKTLKSLNISGNLMVNQ